MNEDATSMKQPAIVLFTIGFAGHSAEEFFGKLQKAGVKTLVDVRLNNVSQLAGFAKRRDLEYFLRVIADIDYVHQQMLAPTKEILDGYKKKRIDWDQYQQAFEKLLEQRRPQQHLRPDELDRACLLCSEYQPHHCHRRLVAEHLQNHWPHLVIEHL